MSARAAFGRICNPLRLQMIDDAPPLIAIRGQARALALPLVAIVGSRNASGAGLKFTQMIARELGEAGFAVVSGLARGIDAAAHAASLATGTIAVLAGGHAHIYPPEHKDLLDAILPAGAALSREPEPEPRSGGAGDEVEPAPDERARIVALLGPAPVQIDDLVRLSKSSPAVVRMVLLELEIAGRLERHGGGLISLA
jgi:predicted Rossmann fold nucleotide-binding protein DprA/Smf involved in DNA uptake